MRRHPPYNRTLSRVRHK